MFTKLFVVCYYCDPVAAFTSRADADFYAGCFAGGAQVFTVPVFNLDGRDHAGD